MTKSDLQEFQEVVSSVRSIAENQLRSGHRSVTAKSKVSSSSTSMTLEDIRTELGDCSRCKLHVDRNNIVFGVGNPNADLVIVGEAPGRDEDLKGEPFVGRAGKLLTDILGAIGLARSEVYICNVIKCRPPQNRNPEPDEIEQCEPFLKKQIASISPAAILTVGKFAAHALLQVETPISQLRGNFYEYEGIPMIPTYHPAYLLRNPSAKKFVWEDVQKLHARLCEITGKQFTLKGK
ncbi:MAG: uracil-DNA glycosylase [Bdellovibrionota bacterium]